MGGKEDGNNRKSGSDGGLWYGVDAHGAAGHFGGGGARRDGRDAAWRSRRNEDGRSREEEDRRARHGDGRKDLLREGGSLDGGGPAGWQEGADGECPRLGPDPSTTP